MENETYSIEELNEYAQKLNLKKVRFVGEIRKKLDDTTNFEKMSVYRYMRYDHAKSLIVDDNASLYFVSPELWDDPFEKRFVNANYQNAENFKEQPLACMCVTTNSADNEAAAWVLYDKDRKQDLVRVTFNFVEMLKILDSYVADKNAVVYVGGMNYIPKEEIGKQKGNEEFYANFNDETFMKLMLLKRKSFMFEGEVRIMIYGEGVCLNENGAVLVPVKKEAKKGLNLNVRISPDMPEKVVSKELVESELKGFCSVNKSQLYESVGKFTLKKNA